MPSFSDADLLVRHAYAAATAHLLRDGGLVDPLGAGSAILRHFDVRMASPGQLSGADGQVDGRTLWVASELVGQWLDRHRAHRERRVNGWVRLTEAAQAFLLQTALVALRGQPLTEGDLPVLQEALSTTPHGHGVVKELNQRYRIDLATPSELYAAGAPAALLSPLAAQAQSLGPAWSRLLDAPWRTQGGDQALREPPLPVGLPSSDLTFEDRARLIQASTAPLSAPSFADNAQATSVLAHGFSQVVTPFAIIKPCPPAFIFETLAHGYRQVVERAAAGTRQLDGAGHLRPNTRLACVMSALECLQGKVEHVEEYEAALLAGLSNLQRRE